jgi:DNA adenine methylase
MTQLKAPFTWFGGKSAVAGLIWERLGNVQSYIEPFAGSLATLLARPKGPTSEYVREIVNDDDCMVVNFWRACTRQPRELVQAMRRPVYELEVRATNRLLIASRDQLKQQLMDNIDFCDVELAGRWCWGQRVWIGGGWSGRDSMQVPNQGGAAALARAIQLDGLDEEECDLLRQIKALAARLAGVQALCGDWSRCVASDAMLGLPKVGGGPVGIVLDPPYFDYDGATGTYAVKDRGDKPVAVKAREWAIERGDDLRLRVVLCGYEGEHPMPASWECVSWKTRGGYSNIAGSSNDNADRERLWFSPGCVREVGLFGGPT